MHLLPQSMKKNIKNIKNSITTETFWRNITKSKFLNKVNPKNPHPCAVAIKENEKEIEVIKS